MMILTAKVDIKKIMLILAAAAAAILLMILLLGGGKADSAQTAAPATPTNDGRVKFLQDFGWDVTGTPKESSQVRIPEENSEVFDRYNALQKSQGYDLTEFAGKKVMRYVYQVNNYPGATGQVYATLLVYKNRIIGGDVTDTSPKGQIRSFKMPAAQAPAAPTAPTAPAVPDAGSAPEALSSQEAPEAPVPSAPPETPRDA